MLEHGDVGAEILTEGREESGVGFRRVERFSGGADDTDGAEREQDRDRGGVAVDFLREDAAELRALGGRADWSNLANFTNPRSNEEGRFAFT